MRRAPAHAGSLPLSERLAFVVTFIVMAGFVVGLSVLAARPGPRAVLGRSVAASSRTEPAGLRDLHDAQAGSGAVKRAAGAAAGTGSARLLNARLTAALRAALGTGLAHLSVGVADPATGATALYRASRRYYAGGVAGPDILAALLYQHQQAGTRLSDEDAGLAAKMIGNSSGTAAARLWQAIGQGARLAVANGALRLQHTVPGTGRAWRRTRTTAADQLALLADLATARSALDLAHREYALGLMTSAATATQRWGVPAAATPGTSYTVSDGLLRASRRFVVNSIGIIHHKGHELLLVVLSSDWPTEAAGISAVRAAAIAAATVVTA